MTWKLGFFLAIAAFLVSNLYWGYRLIDDGITVTHLTDSVTSQRASLEALGLLVPSIIRDVSKKEFLRIAQQLYPDSRDVFEKDSNVVVEGVAFSFSNGKLSSVKTN